MAFDRHGHHILAYPQGQRGMAMLLSDYAGESMIDLKLKLNERDYNYLKLAREIQSRLAVAANNPKDLTATRHEIVKMLMEDPDGPHLNRNSAYKCVATILGQMAEAMKVDKAVQRMVAIRRNEIAWQKAHDNDDLAGMNAADLNFIRLNQLDTPDEQKLDADAINVPNILVTTNYRDMQSGLPDIDVWEAIEKAERIAKSGIIDLKEGRDYVVSDIAEFDSFKNQQEQLEEKPL